MIATLNIVTNPFHPTLDRIQKPIQRKVKINTLVHRHKINLDKPVICYHNGEALLRKEWSRTLVKDGDVVSFVYLPQGGGGGSNPLRMILMLGMMIFAPYLAGVIAPGIMAAGGLAATALVGGITMVGNMLINALIPPPQPPKSQQQQAMASPSPTYTIGAQGNQARLGQAIPVLYGTMKVFPDFAAQPYAEFENNEQYLYQLFCVSQGGVQLDAANIFIEDSPISSFGSDFQLEVIQPNTPSTLYPSDVYNVAEVAGQELLGSTFGPFAVSPATTTVNKLSFDVVLPRGLNYVNDTGGLDSRSISFQFTAQLIDDAGAVLAAAINLGVETISAATSTPIRKTYKYNVTVGRYRISALRTTAKDTNQRISNDLVWASARGYSASTRNYGDLTLLAIKLKATNTISSQSSRKINIIASRKLEVPTFNAATGAYDWSARVVTQSIAWAIANMCRAAYGAGVTELRYDIAQLTALNAIWTTRGDKLNCVFDSTQTFWEALSMACRAGRCRPYIQGGMIHFVRDSLQTLPTAMFTSRNIVKGSFKITYMMPSADTADAVDIEYFDETTWKPRIVRAQLDAGTPVKIAKIKAFGITNRNQAYKEGMYSAGSNRYRRKEIAFDTELEGHIPALGDLIGVQSDIPEWGQHGEVTAVTAVNGTTSKITSSEPFTWTASVAHFAMLRRADGSAAGPITVTQGADAYSLIYTNTDVDFAIYSGFEKERTHISFGRSGQVIQLARVLSTTPRGNTVSVTCINEDARVHSVDGTVTPLDVYQWSLSAPKLKPILLGFTLNQTGRGTTPSISLSWLPTSGASKYIIEKSFDNINWETVNEVTGSSYSFLSGHGLLYIRIAAYGGVIGPYITKSINVGSVPPPANVISGSISSNGQAYNVSWSAVADCDDYYVEVINAASVKRSFNSVTTNFDYTVENAIADGGPWRAISVNVQARKGIVKSLIPLALAGTNAAPTAPTLIVIPGEGNISITASNCTESDYAGTLIYASATAGFTPSTSNLIYEGAANFYLLRTSNTMYIEAAHYDTYGKTGLNYSTEYSATPLPSLGNKVATVRLYQWALTQPANPNGASTLTWTTGAHTAYTGTGAWLLAPSANPGTAGLNLWEAIIQVVDASIATSTSVNWTSGFTVFSSSVNGATGANGTAGTTGARTAVLEVYQWAAVAPTTFPSGSSTYTWATGQFTAPATLNSWALVPPAPVLGQTLWVARTIFVDSLTSATSAVTWSATAAVVSGAAGSNGASGVNGSRTAVLEVYQWAAVVPTLFPASTSTYTWATGAFTAPATPNSWSLLPGASVAGQTLYACSVIFVDQLTTTTSAVTWGTSTAFAVGAAGATGTAGASGVNALTLTSSNNAHTVPTDSAGNNGVYTGSRTDIHLYEGTTELMYDSVGVNNGTWKAVATPINISPGALFDWGNLLTFGNQFDNAVWSKSNATITANNIAGPDGLMTADMVSRTAIGNHYLYQTYATTNHANKTYSFSIWLKSGTMTGVVNLWINQASSVVTPVTLTPTWTQFSVTGTFGAAPSANIVVNIDPVNDTGVAGDTFYVAFARLQEGSNPSYLAVQDHSAMTADTASVGYAITGKRADGTAIAITEVQSLSKSKAGVIGTNGTSATAYWATVNVAAIQKSLAGVYTPTTGSVSLYSATGSGLPALYAGRFVVDYTLDGTTWVNQYTGAIDENTRPFTPQANIKATRIRAYMAGGLTALLDEVIIPIVLDGESGDSVKPLATYDFAGATLPVGATFSGTVATSDSGTTTTLTTTVADQNVRLTGLALNPADAYLITMKVKLISGTWDGKFYNSNAGHIESASFYKQVPAPPIGVWTAITVDMRELTVGGADYMTGGNVTALRFDFLQGSGEVVALDYITVGKYGVAQNGVTGTTGDSYRVGYAVATLASLNSTPATTTTAGSATFPAVNAFGGSETWSANLSVLVAGQYQFKIDGIYSAATGNTVWGVPYQAALKVGSLSAISANLGSITAGSIALDNVGFIRGGQTAYATGTGFFLGYSETTYKFSLGNATAGLTWDGAALDIKGNMTAGSITLGTGFSASSTGAISIKSATSGARLEIANDVIRVYDAAGVLRVKLGNLLA